MKKFLFSVADVFAYRVNSTDLLFTSQTLTDSTIETTISNEDARSGKGNKLQFVYYHTSEFKINLTEQQWNMSMLAASIGSTIQSNGIRQVSETVTITSNAGTATDGTPVNSYFVTDATVYGTVIAADGTSTKATFGTAGAFTTTGLSDGTYCVVYNVQDSTVKYIDVDANMVPSVIRVVMKAQLGSSVSGNAESSSSVIGEIEVEVPTLQLDPSASTLSMTSSGISTTPMSGRALAYSNSTSGGCVSTEIYAKIKETIYGQAQYSDLKAFVITNSDATVAQSGTVKINTLVIPTLGAPYAPLTGLTFAIDAGTATGTTINSTTGVVTASTTAGTATVTATLSNGASSPTTWTAVGEVTVSA